MPYVSIENIDELRKKGILVSALEEGKSYGAFSCNSRGETFIEEYLLIEASKEEARFYVPSQDVFLLRDLFFYKDSIGIEEEGIYVPLQKMTSEEHESLEYLNGLRNNLLKDLDGAIVDTDKHMGLYLDKFLYAHKALLSLEYLMKKKGADI